jgi:Tfp pilus assembly protein PilV
MRHALAGERGFTLIEAMIAITLVTFGLLAVANVYPQGLALTAYSRDQSKAIVLAQQELEYLKSVLPATSPASHVGDYGTANNPSAYFDLNGTLTSQSAAYFTRDIQVQYWTWNATGCGGSGCFQIASTPYSTSPPSGMYVYRISVATHWLVKGQTSFVSGSITGPNGCVSGGGAVSIASSCVQVSTFTSP